MFIKHLDFDENKCHDFLTQESGLSAWLGSQFVVFQHLPPAAIAFVISSIIAAFTEITGNTATATIFLPIFAELVSPSHYSLQ